MRGAGINMDIEIDPLSRIGRIDKGHGESRGPSLAALVEAIG
jgi:hypothetical protein